MNHIIQELIKYQLADTIQRLK